MDKNALKITEAIFEKFEKSLNSDDFQNIISKTQKASEEELGTFKVVISTDDIDRSGESISIDGWDLKNYMKNPIVLWGHNHSILPVGVATKVYKDGNKLVAEGKFADHEFAQEVRKLYEMGILKTTSVGFIPKKFDEEGNTILEAELLEFSFVSVPMNANALSLLSSSELSIDKMVSKGLFDLQTKDTEAPDEAETAPVSEEDEEVDETPQEEEKDDTEPKTEEEEKDEEEEESEDDEEETEEVEEEDDEKSVVDLINELSAKVDKLVAFQESKDADPKGNEVDEDDEFKSFKEKRQVLQNASSIIGDVLAEARKTYEAKRKSN